MTLQVEVDGEDGLRAPLMALGERLEREGAWFDERFTVHCSGREILVRCPSALSSAIPLLRVPVHTMPPVEDFVWRVIQTPAGRALEAVPQETATNPIHRDVVALMVEIFNLAGKAEDWAASTPWLALADEPELLDTLVATRPHAPKVQAFDALRRDGELDELLIQSFLGSRVFNLAADHRRAAGHGDVDRSTQVFLPAIDYFNHRPTAQGFNIDAQSNPLVMRVAGQPDPQTGEVFVRYTQLDAVDAYLIYGFVDTRAAYLNTCPLDIHAGGCTLSVRGVGGVVRKTLPPALRDIRLFMPQIQADGHGHVTLNKLLIPGPRAPRALQRVLAALLSNLGVSRSRLGPAIASAESQVIDGNKAHWQSIERMAQHLADDHPARILCDHCLDYIERYKRNRPMID